MRFLYHYFHQNKVRVLAKYLSRSIKYYDSCTQLDILEHDEGKLLECLDNKLKKSEGSEELARSSSANDFTKRHAYLLNGNFNHCQDIQGLLENIYNVIESSDRLYVVLYNPYLRWLYAFLTILGLREGQPPKSFVTGEDLISILKLAKFKLIRQKGLSFFPFYFFGLGTYINHFISLIPFISRLALFSVITLKAEKKANGVPSLSIIIPARNEADNMAVILDRIPKFAEDVEVIFVEGHSTDGTWKVIQEQAKKHLESLENKFSKISVYQQSGVGKNDAVRLGLNKAVGDLLVILDADMTVPPESLPKFYKAYLEGHGDFINGSRLVYPMESEAMRFLNYLGNKFFAKSLGIVLDLKLSDSLCGTKMFTRGDYQRIIKWRKDFGDFDPFGDFEFLFSASYFHLDVINLPIHYKARSYGVTQIRRFYHGLLLLKMTLLGLVKIKIFSY